MRALLLPVGDEWYAIPVERAREIVAQPRISPLPFMPPTVLGVFNLRGQIIPTFDTSALLGLGPAGAGPFAVVVDTAEGPAALAVGGLPVKGTLGDSTGPSDATGGVSTHAVPDLTAGGRAERLATLLDVGALVAAAARDV